jgi:hypothetical protein
MVGTDSEGCDFCRRCMGRGGEVATWPVTRWKAPNVLPATTPERGSNGVEPHVPTEHETPSLAGRPEVNEVPPEKTLSAMSSPTLTSMPMASSSNRHIAAQVLAQTYPKYMVLLSFDLYTGQF